MTHLAQLCNLHYILINRVGVFLGQRIAFVGLDNIFGGELGENMGFMYEWEFDILYKLYILNMICGKYLSTKVLEKS